MRVPAERRDGPRYEIVDKAYVSRKPQMQSAAQGVFVLFASHAAASSNARSRLGKAVQALTRVVPRAARSDGSVLDRTYACEAKARARRARLARTACNIRPSTSVRSRVSL